jgi:hypothetical protein
VSRHAAVETDFGDGTYTFRLGLDEIEELERKRDLSIFTIMNRLRPEVREPRLADISEVIRLGLIGGGMKPIDALALTRRYVDQRPIDENRDVALAIVLAGLSRLHTEAKDPPSGEPNAPKKGSTSAPSEEPQPQ